jgi:hypothetical protein
LGNFTNADAKKKIQENFFPGCSGIILGNFRLPGKNYKVENFDFCPQKIEQLGNFYAVVINVEESFQLSPKILGSLEIS